MSEKKYSEISSKKYDNSYDLNIITMKDSLIKTDIPLRKGVEVVFSKDDDLQISYFFGHFVYKFLVHFIERKEDHYIFEIISADIDENNRKERRSNVEMKAIFWSKKGMEFGEVLDLSDSGMKMRTLNPIKSKKLDIFLSDNKNENIKLNAVIKWSKKLNNGKHEYGMQIKKKK